MNSATGPAFTLVSALASAPLILTLVASCLICLRQRERRPRTAWLIGSVSLLYLVWVTLGVRIFVLALQLGGLNFSITKHGEFVWIAKTIAVTAMPATLHAVIWGSALWAILVVKED